jgi:heterotetrameric sarcosine oxidase gamma subunit
VVVIGGGIVGASIAYHLAQDGVGEVVLLERHELTSGTTWHAAGLVAQLRASESLTRLSRYSLELYKNLEAQTGQSTGFHQPGAISVATTVGRFEELRRTATMAANLGVEVNVIGPADVARMWPIADVSDIVGAVHLPHDGFVGPTDTTMALIKGAKQRGALVFEHTNVTGLVVERGRCVGVTTSSGTMACDTVVLAAGLWSRDFAAQYGVTLPLFGAEHYYVVTDAMPGLSRDLPVLRDPDRCAYYKSEGEQLLVGLFEKVARPWPAVGEEYPKKSFITLDANTEHLMPLLDTAFGRIPALQETGLKLLFNGPESFTPDDRYIIGPTPGLEGMFVAAGFNSIGIQSAGGVGMALSRWIIDGRPPMDLWDVDVRRFENFQRNRRYLRERTTESLGLLYQMHWPFRQVETARNIRRSALHDRLAARGACFGELSGWERPNWFGTPGTTPTYEYSYGRQNWFEANAAEHRAVRENVGLFDQSSFAKFLLQGRDAQRVIDVVSANDMNVAPGKVVYTQWCNDGGGIEADLTVTRISEESFMVVTAPGTRRRDFEFLRASIDDAHATLTDVTSGVATITVMGPNSRALLSTLTDADLSNEGFPFGTSREIELGSALVRALRVTYVGELGWELYVPTEFATHVYDELMRAGSAFELKLCGFHTLNSCRMEKAYRHWSHDIGPDDSPLHAGLGFAVAWDKSTLFRGRDALLRSRDEGVQRRLVQFAVHDADAMLYHHEPILRNGEAVGWITSGMWGHTLNAAVGLGYARNNGGVVDVAWVSEGTWEVDIAGRRFPAAASLRPMYDPASSRVRS